MARLREENSSYVVDGAIHLKVFVRPVAFHKDVETPASAAASV